MRQSDGFGVTIMAGAQKKVIVRLFSGEATAGYLPAAGFVDGQEVVLMDLEAKSIRFALSDIRWIAYVRDFNIGDPDPERFLRRTFPARPRQEGLWLRITLRDGDVFEGMSSADLSVFDAFRVDSGVFISPPDGRSNSYRVFVPRAAMRGMELVAVVSSAAKRKAEAAPKREPQPWLFGDS